MATRRYPEDTYSGPESDGEYSGSQSDVDSLSEYSESDTRRKTQSGTGYTTVSAGSLPPVWADKVQPDGSLFYLEQYSGGKELNGEVQSPPNGKAPNGHVQPEKKETTKESGISRIRGLLKKRTGKNKDSTDSGQSENSMALYEVRLKVDPTKLQKEATLETLLGIVPKPIVRNAGDAVTGNSRMRQILLQTLLPDGPAIKATQLRIGDCLVAVNDFNVNMDNINQLLSAIVTPMEVKLTMEPVPEPWEPPEPPPFVKEPARPSELVKLVSGQDLSTYHHLLEKIPHIVMYLTMGSDSNNTHKEEEILYSYPDGEASRRLRNIRGMFITIGDILQNVTGTRVKSSTLVVDKQHIHIGYWKKGEHLLVLGLPGDKVKVEQLNHMVSDVVRFLTVIYGSIESAFSTTGNISQLDHFFSLLFKRVLLGGLMSSSLQPDDNSSAVMDTIMAVPTLHIPEDIKTPLDAALSELEAADFADMSDDYYDLRRAFTVLGSCMFYKGLLAASHLPREDLLDVFLYCRYYCLLALASEERVGQLVLWREVHPTRRFDPAHGEADAQGYSEPEGRWFLLIVGLRHWLSATLLEAGGCAARAEGSVSPDPFLVDQTKAVILQLETQNVGNLFEDRLQSPTNPALSCAEWFLPSSREKSVSNASSTSSILGTPVLGRHQSSSPKPLKLFQRSPQSSFLQVPGARTEGDNISHSGSEHSGSGVPSMGGDSPHSTPSLGRRHLRKQSEGSGSGQSGESGNSSGLFKVKSKRLIPDAFEMSNMNRVLVGQDKEELSYSTKLTCGVDNTLFHYLAVNSAAGVVVCPTQQEVGRLGGALHMDVIRNFYRCCQTIHGMFENSAQVKELRDRNVDGPLHTESPLGVVTEQGVLFHCGPANLNDSKRGTTPTITYWVVGRLYMAKEPKEVFVCFQDGTQDNVVEMAFKLLFGTDL
ncbi:protein inturned-like isoform X2 [Branchiostoma floridae x Branchiostoma japonicum]